MKVGIVGSRNFNNYSDFKEYISELDLDISTIISGGAMGADTLAERYAKENDIELLVFKAEWTKYGKGAGFIRNTKIVNESDLIVAFWDGNSHGTKDTITKANKKDVPVKIFYF